MPRPAPSQDLPRWWLGASVAAMLSTAAIADGNPIRNTKEWELPKSKLAIQGYDPVAYFPEGGGKAAKGDPKITLTYEGVVYRFATKENRERFNAKPAGYEPAHGGWCSWAMLRGEKTAPDPETYVVSGDRLFLFYNGVFGDTKKSWEKGDHDSQAAKADAAWKKLSGENPRRVPA